MGRDPRDGAHGETNVGESHAKSHHDDRTKSHAHVRSGRGDEVKPGESGGDDHQSNGGDWLGAKTTHQLRGHRGRRNERDVEWQRRNTRLQRAVTVYLLEIQREVEPDTEGGHPKGEHPEIRAQDRTRAKEREAHQWVRRAKLDPCESEK